MAVPWAPARSSLPPASTLTKAALHRVLVKLGDTPIAIARSGVWRRECQRSASDLVHQWRHIQSRCRCRTSCFPWRVVDAVAVGRVMVALSLAELERWRT